MKTFKFIHLFSVAFIALSLNAHSSNLTVEELRIEKAQQTMPNVFTPLNTRVESFKTQVNKARNLTALTQLVIKHGNLLWQEGVKAQKQSENFDDRSLYWARLQMAKALRQSSAYTELLPMQQQPLMWQFELLSRGQADVNFNQNTNKKILLTGFDPFFLDRDITQSNPSGVTALALDNMTLRLEGQSVEIETLIVPVRFADFDQGIIEELLSTYYKKVDMIVTVSKGSDDFDLERFPGLRRSAKAPGNLNVFTGANSQKPLKPLLNGKPLEGREFVEFSLPVTAMQKANGAFAINDNANITTMEGKLSASSLAEFANKTSVEGSGGGYLSNEISYRSILLRNKYNPILPVGHIHTPRFKGFNPEKSKKIVQQIKQMLTLAIKDI